MCRRLAILALSACAILGAAGKKPITLDALFDGGSSRAERGAPNWAPDGKRFVYLEGRRLWLYDVPAKTSREVATLGPLDAAAVPVPEPAAFGWQNRGVREQNIQWFPSGNELLISSGRDLFMLRLASGGFVQLTATPISESDPKLSPDGRRVSFRRDHDLYVMEIASRKVTRLTDDGSATLLNAELDWVYPEELDLGTAHWWSPDSKRIAYLQFDISRELIYPQTDLTGLRARYEPERYPQAGTPNADVRLGIVAADGGRTEWMDLGQTRDKVFPRVAWSPDSSRVTIVRMNRIQNELDLLAADPKSGSSKAILHESDPHWIDIPAGPRFIKGGKEFLWLSDRDGYRHVYRYGADGSLLNQVTRGEWVVTGIEGVDENASQLYFTGKEASPLESHLYRVGLDGSGRKRLTEVAGSHTINMSPSCEYYLDSFSNLTTPPGSALFKSDGTRWASWREPNRKPLEEYEILPAEIVQVKASDGTVLYARLIKPAGFEPGKKYPAVVSVYGGPHAQSVRNAFSGLSLDQVLAHQGYAVWELDNRGTAGRGRKFEAPVFRNLGARELEDQKDGVRHLVSLGFVDEKRIGIHGWSYGGFMTLYSLLNAPDLFAAGIAGAPVTNWNNYDTIYTERYMGLPSENEDGYRKSAPVNAAANLKARLLLLHNFEDDNVLFQNTMQIADALQRADKVFEMVVYPQKSHGVGGPVRKQMYRTMVEFFDRTLKK